MLIRYFVLMLCSGCVLVCFEICAIVCSRCYVRFPPWCVLRLCIGSVAVVMYCGCFALSLFSFVLLCGFTCWLFSLFVLIGFADALLCVCVCSRYAVYVFIHCCCHNLPFRGFWNVLGCGFGIGVSDLFM